MTLRTSCAPACTLLISHTFSICHTFTFSICETFKSHPTTSIYLISTISNLHIFHFPYFSFAPSYPSYFQTQFQQLNMQQYIHFPIHTFPLHCQTFYFLYLSYFLLSPHHFHLSHYHPLIHFNVQSHNAICHIPTSLDFPPSIFIFSSAFPAAAAICLQIEAILRKCDLLAKFHLGSRK